MSLESEPQPLASLPQPPATLPQPDASAPHGDAHVEQSPQLVATVQHFVRRPNKPVRTETVVQPLPQLAEAPGAEATDIAGAAATSSIRSSHWP